MSLESWDKSLFCHGSRLTPDPSHGFTSNGASFVPRFSSAQRLREQRKAEQDAQVMWQHMDRNTDMTTISPKDIILEYHDQEAEPNSPFFPLFPQQGHREFDADQMAKAVPQARKTSDDVSMDGFNFNYWPSYLPTDIQVPQRYPLIAHPRQQSSSAPMSDASMTVPPVNSTETGSSNSTKELNAPSPTDAGADWGTYTCTYHDCILRFETSALLQKHKRGQHQQAYELGSTRRADKGGMASSLLDSQAGPHRCDRINPNTDKPCNNVFSRPYDLTRHEDTIHNARKQKVRCNLCREEKNFSRADALIRHYRVCHPDMESPGKHRR